MKPKPITYEIADFYRMRMNIAKGGYERIGLGGSADRDLPFRSVDIGGLSIPGIKTARLCYR